MENQFPTTRSNLELQEIYENIVDVIDFELQTRLPNENSFDNNSEATRISSGYYINIEESLDLLKKTDSTEKNPFLKMHAGCLDYIEFLNKQLPDSICSGLEKLAIASNVSNEGKQPTKKRRKRVYKTNEERIKSLRSFKNCTSTPKKEKKYSNSLESCSLSPILNSTK